MPFPKAGRSPGRTEHVPVQATLIGSSQSPDDNMTSQHELLLRQIKHIVKEEMHFVTIGQEKIEELIRKSFARGACSDVQLKEAFIVQPQESCQEKPMETFALEQPRTVPCIAKQPSMVVGTQSLSERLKQNERNSAPNQDASKKKATMRQTQIEELRCKAQQAAETAMSMKKWMSTSAYQATLENKELDTSNTWIWPGRARFEQIVCNSAFDVTAGLFIVANSITIGVDIDFKARRAPSTVFHLISIAFAIVFIIETITRVAANHIWTYFRGPDRHWNLFDLLMLVVSLLEVADSSNASGKKGKQGIIRMVKMVRLLRIVRVMRFVPQLRIMVFMILESAKSLLWLLVILVTILYVFAIVFTMAGTEYLIGSGDQDGEPDRPYSDEVALYYGSVLRSVYTCFRAITSGQSWGEVLDPLIDISGFYAIIFLFFIAFSLFALFNIITGVFVDGAMEKSRMDRDLVVEKEVAYKKACIENLKLMFQESDADNSGTISIREFEAHMVDPKFESYLGHLGIDTSNCCELFSFLDTDGSGHIDMEEFVSNMMHLIRGQSTEQYTQKLLRENQVVLRHLDAFMDFVENEFMEMKRFTVLGGPPALNRQASPVSAHVASL